MGLVTRARQPQKSYPANFSNEIVQEFIRDFSNDKIPYPIKKSTKCIALRFYEKS